MGRKLRERFPGKAQMGGKFTAEVHKYTRVIYDKRLSNFHNRMRAKGWTLVAEWIETVDGVTYHLAHWKDFITFMDDEPHRAKTKDKK